MSYCALDVNLCIYVNKRPKRPSAVRTKVQNNQDFIVQHSYELQSHSKEKIQGISPAVSRRRQQSELQISGQSS